MSEGTSPILPATYAITMYATRWCGACRRARRRISAHGIAYEYLDIDRDDQAAPSVMQVNGGMRSVPTIVFPDGAVLAEPTSRELEARCFPNGERPGAKRDQERK